MPGYKVIKSGHIIEVYKYEKSIIVDEMKEKEPKRKGGRDKEGNEDRKDEYVQTVNTRARNNLRRLIQANFNAGDLFITLTFKENVTDIEKANYEFKKFIQKIKRRYKNLKFVSVLEFQKRGAIHYHMLCDYPLTWENETELRQLEREVAAKWGNGFVDIKETKDIDNLGAYLIKYMTKDFDERLEGKKRYFHSRNLIKPETIVADNLKSYLDTVEGMTPVFTNTYQSQFNGKVDYYEYNPKRS